MIIKLVFLKHFLKGKLNRLMINIFFLAAETQEKPMERHHIIHGG